MAVAAMAAAAVATTEVARAEEVVSKLRKYRLLIDKLKKITFTFTRIH